MQQAEELEVAPLRKLVLQSPDVTIGAHWYCNFGWAKSIGIRAVAFAPVLDSYCLCGTVICEDKTCRLIRNIYNFCRRAAYKLCACPRERLDKAPWYLLYSTRHVWWLLHRVKGYEKVVVVGYRGAVTSKWQVSKVTRLLISASCMEVPLTFVERRWNRPWNKSLLPKSEDKYKILTFMWMLQSTKQPIFIICLNSPLYEINFDRL